MNAIKPSARPVEHIFDGEIREPLNREAAMMLSRKYPQPGPGDSIDGLNTIGILSTVIGRLTIVGRSVKHPNMWHIRCSCGTEFMQPDGYLKSRTPANAMCSDCRSPQVRRRTIVRRKDFVSAGFSVGELAH